MDDVPFDLRSYRVITYDKDNPTWGVELQKNIVEFLKETLANPIEAVPSVFRKSVKSQAPSESETSLRLRALERKIETIEQKRPMLIGKKFISMDQAERIIRDCVESGFTSDKVIGRFEHYRISQDWILKELNKQREDILPPDVFKG